MKLSFCLLASVCLVLIGCSSREKKESSQQIFRMNLHSEPTSLDPRHVRDIPTLTTGKMFFDGLTRANLKGEILPSMASKISISPDKTVYTFTLRDALWSNGMAVTAYDFEYAWKTLLTPDFPSEFAHQLFIIKNAEAAKKGLVPLSEVAIVALNAKKLIVTLDHPNPYFLELTSFPITFPICSEVAKKNPQWASEQGENFVSNGPFKLVKWQSGNELVAHKNPLFWDAPAVKLNRIVLTMIEDEHTELNMYENNELDWAGSPNSSIPPEALPSLKERERESPELFVTPIAGTFCYKFNTRQAPFTSLKMRQAFAFAIDRTSLVNNVLQANQIVATSLLPPCMKESGAPQVALFSECSKQKALTLFNEALEECGWTRETLPPITLIFSKSEKHQKVAQAIQQEWSNAFQIKINLQSYEWNTFLGHLAKGDFQVGGRGWISDISDPKTLLEVYKFASSGNNDTGWEKEQFISLINTIEKTADPQKRSALLLEAETLLLNDMPIVPLYHSTACYLKKPYVKDVYMSKLCDLDLKNAYIER